MQVTFSFQHNHFLRFDFDRDFLYKEREWVGRRGVGEIICLLRGFKCIFFDNIALCV